MPIQTRPICPPTTFPTDPDSPVPQATPLRCVPATWCRRGRAARTVQNPAALAKISSLVIIPPPLSLATRPQTRRRWQSCPHPHCPSRLRGAFWAPLLRPCLADAAAWIFGGDAPSHLLAPQCCPAQLSPFVRPFCVCIARCVSPCRAWDLLIKTDRKFVVIITKTSIASPSKPSGFRSKRRRTSRQAPSRDLELGMARAPCSANPYRAGIDPGPKSRSVMTLDVAVGRVSRWEATSPESDRHRPAVGLGLRCALSDRGRAAGRSRRLHTASRSTGSFSHASRKTLVPSLFLSLASGQSYIVTRSS